MSQDKLMNYCPATGEPNAYPSHAAQYRKFHGNMAWLWNPWTGKKRHPLDIGSDVFGLLIAPTDIDELSAEKG